MPSMCLGAKAAVKTMKKVERKSPGGRIAAATAGIILLALGFGMLKLLLPILVVMFSH